MNLPVNHSLLVHRFYIFFLFFFRIGFAIARRLGEDGAKVVVSSRKQQNVDKAVKALQNENLDVCGVVCHVGKKEDRHNLIQKVS
jgi:short-subunit dehydrogenase involved in D-alanine esterification of teichoic acids